MSTAIELMEKSCFNINEAERLKKEAKDLRRQALSELLISMGIEEGKTVLTSPAGAKGVLRIVKCDLRGWDIEFYRLKKDGTPSCKKTFVSYRNSIITHFESFVKHFFENFIKIPRLFQAGIIQDIYVLFMARQSFLSDTE